MYLYIVINFYKIFSTILNFKLYSFEDTFIYIYILEEDKYYGP